MASLLTIPREIRDKILREALLLPVQQAPRADEIDDVLASRVELRENGVNKEKEKAMKSWTCGNSVQYPKATPCPVHPIFLVNKQINAEAKDVLSRLPGHYILDVVLYKEIYLIPTWLVMPHFQHSVPHRIDSITCNFRIVGSFDGYAPGVHYSGFRGGDGAGPAMAWVLYSLLERFFYFGPFWRSAEDETEDFVVEDLIIDVQTPPKIPPQHFLSQPLSNSLRQSRFYETPTEEINSPVLGPLYLFNFMKGEIGSLLVMDYHTAQYGDILYYHLGRVEITLDGKDDERRKKWDLALVLQLLDPQYTYATTSQQMRRDGFLDWKPRAMAARKKSGLGWVAVQAWDGGDLEYVSYDSCMDTAYKRIYST